MLILLCLLSLFMITHGTARLIKEKYKEYGYNEIIGITLVVVGAIALCFIVPALIYYTNVVIGAQTLESRIVMYKEVGHMYKAAELQNQLLNMQTYRWWLYFG